MPPRSPWARLALGAVGMAAAIVGAAGACADVLHVTYRVSLIGLPIGAVNLNANLTPTSYSIQGDAKLTGLARLLNNARGAWAGKGAIVEGHVSPATFATIAANSHMTRTIRMALAGNAVTGVDISPPYEDKPDRIPLGPGDEKGIVDLVGAVSLPARLGTDRVAGRMRTQDFHLRRLHALRHQPHLCRRAAGGDQRLRGPGGGLRRAMCRCRPPASRPATKFMADNKDLEVWLAPIEKDQVLIPFRVSVRTMIGTTVVEATEFRVDEK